MLDPWLKWAKERREGRDPSREIRDEVVRQSRAMVLEMFISISLAGIVGWRVIWQMGHHARGVTLIASSFLTGWTGALAITLIVLRRGTFMMREDTPRGHLDLSRRRMVSLMKLTAPMRVGLGAMGLFLAFWLPWQTWFAPHLRRQSVTTGLVRMAIAAALLWFLFAVLKRLREVTAERITAIDSLLESVDRPAGRKG